MDHLRSTKNLVQILDICPTAFECLHGILTNLSWRLAVLKYVYVFDNEVKLYQQNIINMCHKYLTINVLNEKVDSKKFTEIIKVRLACRMFCHAA